METEKVDTYEGYISIPEGKSGDVEVVHVVRPKGTKLSTANIRCQIMGGQDGVTLKYNHESTWHSLQEKGRGVWMTDDPCEQAQMRKLVDHLYGDVLVGGLGLGVVVKMLAGKEDVTSITVVERSRDVINLVWEPTINSLGEGYFDPELEIIEGGLFEELKRFKQEGRQFDSALYDIWQGDNEGVFFNVVVPLRKLSWTVVDGEVECWNENVMRGQLRNGLFSRVEMVYNEEWAKQLGGTCEDALERLCNSDDKWINWSEEFFRWIRDDRPDKEEAIEQISEFIAFYETHPNWLEAWK
jgi:hypothetical protein